MRLIDAGAWIKEFDEVITELEKLNNKESISREDYIKLIKIIKGSVEEQPTAYDVEKVVEELENQRIEVQKMRNDCIALSDAEVCDIENATYGRAIDIVRKGGVK